MWKIGDISSSSENDGQGCVSATFELSSEHSQGSPAKPSLAAVQFSIEGTTLSGINFELVGSGYRMSLLKRRVVSG